MDKRIRLRKAVPVIAIDEYGHVVARFPSQTEAASESSTSQGAISEACRGIRKQAGGYCWELAR